MNSNLPGTTATSTATTATTKTASAPATRPATIADALHQAQRAGIARIDAQLLLLHALGRSVHDRAWLLAHDTDPLATDAALRFDLLCSRRADDEPVAYLLGSQEFFGLPLQVDARVLVPRADTETLVRWALDVLDVLDVGDVPQATGEQSAPDAAAGIALSAPIPSARSAPSVLDLGTGSGAVALALQHARPDARVHAVDASADALAVARSNAERLDVPVVFALGCWLDGHTAQHDLIVSNPPYVAAGDPHLHALRHEPIAALAAGPDGLNDLRAIVADAARCLLPGGWLLLEHAWDQAESVRALLIARGFDAVQSRCDLAGIERCSGGSWSAMK